jgi:hypothetical protein
MKTLFVLLGLGLSVTANADFTCTVTKVLDDGAFENVNDFTFEDYNYLALETTAQTTKVDVGGLGFDTTDSDIRVTGTRSYVSVVVKPFESDQVFRLHVYKNGSKKQTGLFFYQEGNQPEVRVASLFCKQGR